jgi:hypothetical protein
MIERENEYADKRARKSITKLFFLSLFFLSFSSTDLITGEYTTTFNTLYGPHPHSRGDNRRGGRSRATLVSFTGWSRQNIELDEQC